MSQSSVLKTFRSCLLKSTFYLLTFDLFSHRPFRAFPASFLNFWYGLVSENEKNAFKSVKLPSLTEGDLLKTNEGLQSQEILNFAKTIFLLPSLDVSLSNLAPNSMPTKPNNELKKIYTTYKVLQLNLFLLIIFVIK